MSTAFVDESESNHRLDPHAYLLGSAVIAEVDVADVRAEMERLRLRGERKLHWRSESERRQADIARAIAQLPVDMMLVAHVDASRTPEARRRRAMACLLPALHSRGVGEALFESRGSKDDRRDRVTFENLRRSRRFDPTLPTLRVSHEPGPNEPCLWIADAVCGAVVSHRIGDSRFVAMLGERLAMLDCQA